MDQTHTILESAIGFLYILSKIIFLAYFNFLTEFEYSDPVTILTLICRTFVTFSTTVVSNSELGIIKTEPSKVLTLILLK
jgi:hypothetical protein